FQPVILYIFTWRCSSVGQSTRLISAASVVRLHSPPLNFSLATSPVNSFSWLKSALEKSGILWKELAPDWPRKLGLRVLTASCIRSSTTLRYFVVVVRLVCRSSFITTDGSFTCDATSDAK